MKDEFKSENELLNFASEKTNVPFTSKGEEKEFDNKMITALDK